MTSRYLIGLGFAFLLIGAFLAATVVTSGLLTGRPPLLAGVVDVWLAFALPTVALLAVVVGPAVLLVRHRLGRTLTVARAAALGAGTGPVSLLLIWWLFRESNETLPGLFAFWLQLPMEFIVGVLPHAAAGAAFAAWLASARREDQPQAA